MGCDVHGHFEVQVGGKWEHYSETNMNNDYEKDMNELMNSIEKANELICKILEKNEFEEPHKKFRLSVTSSNLELMLSNLTYDFWELFG